MSEKKRQHYVPKFLLKNFSVNGNNKQINIYNVINNTTINSASLKEQAAENYFYGKDGVIENNFEKLETESAKIFSNIILEKLPIYNSCEHLVILHFTLTLGSRTLYKTNEHIELINKFLKNIASKDAKMKDLLNKYEIKVQNPSTYSLKLIEESLPLVRDLKFKLLVNKTEIPFIISDNPVVYYNQFLEGKKKVGSNIGVAVKGLQIFLPISPFCELLFYDSNVYKIGSTRQNIIEIKTNDDIISLNGLQYLNANINLYFDNKFSSTYIYLVKTNYEKKRRKKKVNISEYTEANPNKKYPNILLHFYREDIKCNLSLTFIKIIKKAKNYDLGAKLTHYRKEKLVMIYREFYELVQKKIYKSTEFNKFLMDKNNRTT